MNRREFGLHVFAIVWCALMTGFAYFVEGDKREARLCLILWVVGHLTIRALGYFGSFDRVTDEEAGVDRRGQGR